MWFLLKLGLPIVFVFMYRGGRPFAGTHSSRFVGDILFVLLGWVLLFKPNLRPTKIEWQKPG